MRQSRCTPFICAVSVLLTGCANRLQHLPEFHCSEPRPTLCTQQYAPVCATQTDGQQNTYSNSCRACSDSAVIGFDARPCGQEG